MAFLQEKDDNSQDKKDADQIEPWVPTLIEMPIDKLLRGNVVFGEGYAFYSQTSWLWISTLFPKTCMIPDKILFLHMPRFFLYKMRTVQGRREGKELPTASGRQQALNLC